MTVPISHLQEAVKLEADAYVDLFEIALKPSGFAYIKADDTVSWRGNTYEGLPVKMTQVSAQVDGSVSRPNLQIANPAGMFSIFVVQGYLNNAVVRRHRVLRTDLLANNNISLDQLWIVGRVTSLDKNQITLELRSYLDGPLAVVPNRTFCPPDFPQCSLS